VYGGRYNPGPFPGDLIRNYQNSPAGPALAFSPAVLEGWHANEKSQGRRMNDTPVSKNDELRYGPLGSTCVHICVDMQRLFAEPTEWQMPWLQKVLPTIARLVAAHPAQTLFTRFIPARRPGQGAGMWKHYYERWGSMTIEELGAPMIDLVSELAAFVPPARVFDKHVYSPWIGTNLNELLRGDSIDTIVISGGETDVCVQATVMGAIDWGFRTILATDALCSSSDEAHDALMEFYQGRLGEQLETASAETILRNWR
jgi:nicotinamidase-related amidase